MIALARAALCAMLFVIAPPALAQTPHLTLHPGLTVNFSVYGGFDSAGKLLGDYDVINRVTQVSGGSYAYDFWFTGPDPNSGSQTISAADKKTGVTLREFYPSGDLSAKGYVSLLALSDATFADVKAGKETVLKFDAADSPRTIRKVGEEDLTTLVDEQPTKIHAIEAKGANGALFWILDDDALPLVVKAAMKWKWMVTAISDSGSAGSQLVDTLKRAHEATTHAILFAFNSADLDREAKPVLDSVAQYLKGAANVKLDIAGHTDNIGGAPFNLALSQKRAEAVRAYLTAAGIDQSRLSAKGFGLSVPVADNTTPEGRAQNRRVVFKEL